MLNVSEPVIIRSRYWEIVCFYEGDDRLLDFRPAPRFSSPRLDPQQPAFSVGDVINTPKGCKTVKKVETIPLLDVKRLEKELKESLAKTDISGRSMFIFTSELVSGFRYEVQ